MSQTDCIFCKIIKGDVPSTEIYEDEDVKIIMDIEPVSKGHAILIVKEHAANIYELSEGIAEKVLPAAQKAASAMRKALKAQGMNLLQNNGEIAGQSVFHFHIHIIPRYTDDHVKLGGKTEEGYSVQMDVKALAEEIRAYME